MLVIGLTGGIATGKSTVSSMLRQRGLPIVDADVLAREVIAPGTSGYAEVVAHFGRDRVVKEDGVTLDRAAIGDIVFRDATERAWLNGVVHPRVKRAMVSGLLRAWLRGEWACVVDVPLLIEGGLDKWVGEVVVVYVNDKLQLARLLARPADPPLTPQQAQARMNAQMPVSSKLARATTVLDNSGTLADLESQLDRVVAKWRAAQGGESGWWWRLCWLVPPVGLAAGLICLLARWARARKPRRRTRGEGDEAFEMKPLRRP